MQFDCGLHGERALHRPMPAAAGDEKADDHRGNVVPERKRMSRRKANERFRNNIRQSRGFHDAHNAAIEWVLQNHWTGYSRSRVDSMDIVAWCPMQRQSPQDTGKYHPIEI